MEKTVDGLITRITSASSTMAGPKGRINTGSNFLNNALGAFSTDPGTRYTSAFNMGMGVVRGTGQMVQGATQMMPDISATMDRMTTYYNASLRASGGMSRNQVQQMTMGAMQNGMTAPGSDAMVGGYLSMRGMIADASFGSTYQQTVRGVGNAAQYLNMSNERAVAAIEGLTSGQGSSNMLRQFGIFTADPRTGKEKTQGQIMQELYGRLTAGKGQASEQQVMESFRRGALGATLRASGLSEDQQQMFVQYSMERARGNNMDLSDPEAMEELMNKAKAEGNENPNLPGYAMNTSKTNAMQNAQEAYLAGIQAVTPVLQGLTEAGGLLAGAFGMATAAVAAFSASAVGGGALTLLGGAGKVGLGVGMLGMASKASGSGGLVSKAFGGAKGTIGKGMGVAGAAVGTVATAASIGGAYETAKSGGDALGNVLASAGSGALTGASIGMFFGPKGALIGGAIGGLVGGIGGGIAAMTGASAEGGDQGSSNTNGTGAPQQFKLMHPTKSAQITAVFGQRESSFTKGKITWPNGHKGIDYAGKEGDTIFASEGGYATIHDGGQLGKRVRIKHANGMYTHYCHLSSITVREGEVKKGQPVGGMGSTGGKSTGVHLHFALSTGPDTSSAIDPMPYLGGGGNYLSSPPQDAEQSASSNSPTSAGTTSAATNPGGEDSSPTSPTAPTNRSEGTATNVPTAPGGSGSSAADGVESWSAGSIWSSGGGANTAAAPEGGENASDQPGYLSPASSASPSSTRSKNGRETKVVTNNVSINLSIEKGTPEEARRFAQMVKRALENDNAMTAMARN
jgi:hypothetical protein